MKSNYEERKANRLEAFENLAAKNGQAASDHFDTSRKLGDAIPFGQPILVGHHSEKRHRKHLDKIHNEMGKGVEASNKAEYYKSRAESLLNGTAISSDDPNATDKLAEKLERLEAQQELMKACNKIVKKAKMSDVQKVAELVELGLKESTAVLLIKPDQWGRVGIPSYQLTNNNAVIRNTRERIEHLNRMAAIPDSEEEVNGITLKVNTADNRVQIFFPDTPSEEVRKELKSNGFHWSHSIGAWMRQISNSAIYHAKRIIEKVN